jgi:hypothetical protein
MTRPRFLASCSSTTSCTLRLELHRVKADECENITGASVTASTSFMVASDDLDRSTIMPSRFISRTMVWEEGEKGQTCEYCETHSFHHDVIVIKLKNVISFCIYKRFENMIIKRDKFYSRCECNERKFP